jgi:hypothetical protein
MPVPKNESSSMLKAEPWPQLLLELLLLGAGVVADPLAVQV